MKPFFLLGLLMLGFWHCAGQKIRFTDTGNKWSLIYFTDDPYASSERSWYGNDTLIAGGSYRQLYTSQRGTSLKLAIREDTLQEKLFFRFTTLSSDTGEHLFFDYRLKAGDTLHIANKASLYNYVIQKRDSVQLGGIYYRHWVLQAATPTFDFIEAVGTNHYPLQLVYPANGLSGFQLRCFTNRGTNPVCRPAVLLPYGAYIPHFSSEPYGVAAFDNDTSCRLRYLPNAVNPLSAGQFSIYPNPGGDQMVLSWQPGMVDVLLQVNDFCGRVVLAQRVHSRSSFPIGQYLNIPGMYTYILQDAASGKRFAGRFVFQ